MPAKQPSKKINELLEKVDTVLEHQEKLEKKQEIILAAVKTDEKEDEELQTEVNEEIGQVKTIAKEMIPSNTFKDTFFLNVKKHEVLFPLIAIVGIVLVWKGLWGILDQLPIVSYSAISLLLGVCILWIFNRVKSL